MELEAKHLCPYLPYGLKLQYIVRDKLISTGIMKSIIHNDSETHPTKININYQGEEHIWMFKPILRPLSDIDKELFINGSFGFIPINYFLGEDSDLILNAIQIKDLSFIPYNLINKLFEWHFDVFGLIPAGLAVSIHDVGQVVA